MSMFLSITNFSVLIYNNLCLFMSISKLIKRSRSENYLYVGKKKKFNLHLHSDWLKKKVSNKLFTNIFSLGAFKDSMFLKTGIERL